MWMTKRAHAATRGGQSDGRYRGTWRNDPEKFIKHCADEAERSIRLAFTDFTRKAAAFRKKRGHEGVDISLYAANCYFYYSPGTERVTTFCVHEPSENEPDIIVTVIFERAV